MTGGLYSVAAPISSSPSLADLHAQTIDSFAAGLLQLAPEACSSAAAYLAGPRGPTVESFGGKVTRVTLPCVTLGIEMTTALSRSRQKSPLDELVPDGLGDLSDEQTAIPRIARDPALTATIAGAVERVPTAHRLLLGDSRDLSKLESGSVHLVLTSPPYWTLKEYREASGQLGAVADYERFVAELDRVWRECFRLLAPGGRLVCVVGDVLLSRRRNNGRHVVVPLHASIQTHCRTLGFDNLAPIIWHKIGNADYEAGGGGFLGKPYEPNAIIKE